jgi:hypothetical protein
MSEALKSRYFLDRVCYYDVQRVYLSEKIKLIYNIKINLQILNFVMKSALTVLTVSSIIALTQA